MAKSYIVGGQSITNSDVFIFGVLSERKRILDICEAILSDLGADSTYSVNEICIEKIEIVESIIKKIESEKCNNNIGKA